MQTKTLIIAEAGVNHNGSLAMAKQLVDVAKTAGADIIKFQSFKAENLVSENSLKATYQIQNTGNNESQFSMLQALELTEAEHIALYQYCLAKEITFLSTPFDNESLQMLDKNFAMPFIKVPSGEINNAPFLLEIARTQKKVILSTGMSLLGEVEFALAVLAFGYLYQLLPKDTNDFWQAYNSIEGQEILRAKVSLLHCTTEYPAPYGDVNLKVMDTLAQAFGLPVGFSDHTAGIAIPIAAVARGAKIIEKHFTLDKNLPGPDHKASLDPVELQQMVEGIRQVEQALGSSLKKPSAREIDNKKIVRKTLVAACAISCGEKFTRENIAIKRSGSLGLEPYNYWELLGRTARKNYSKDSVLEL